MKVKIAIIGLGQIGTSIGLALGERKDRVYRIGNDKVYGTAKKAQKLGALDKVKINLPATVRDVDLVILSVPFDQMQDTLKVISQDLKDDCVVMETSSAKETVAKWVEEILPKNVHYIGLTPVINPEYLHGIEHGIDGARVDLFNRGVMGITTPYSAKPEVIKMASDLARLLGATPLYTDPLEIDGLMASSEILPLLVSSALVNATSEQPGWTEGRKFAGKVYAEVTHPVELIEEPETLGLSALSNRENTIRMVDTLINTLDSYRTDLENSDEDALVNKIKNAKDNRYEWIHQRKKAEWRDHTEPVDSFNFFGALFGVKTKPKRQK